MVTKAWAVSRSAESPWAFHQLAKQALNPTSCRAVASSQVQAAWHKGTKRSAGEACSEQLFGRHHQCHRKGYAKQPRFRL